MTGWRWDAEPVLTCFTAVREGPWKAQNEIISGEQQRAEAGDAIAARVRAGSRRAVRDLLEFGLGDAGPTALAGYSMRASLTPWRCENASRMLQTRSQLMSAVGGLEEVAVDTHLEFGILGPLEVRLDGTPVRVGGPRQRALLALLLCNANRVVSRDQLIDELLSGQPEGSADRMLRVQISRLRKALADGGGGEPRLRARPPGYSLRVEVGELDLHTFEHLVADGRHAIEQGDPRRAAVLLREAESLWRGRPLADLEFERFARFEVQRLELLRLGTIEERIEAELALARHTALCAELELLVEKHPLNERLRGQLMLALYRSGRQADALATYRAGRSLLVGQLAVEPGPQLKQLQLAILKQDAALDLPQLRPGHGPAPGLVSTGEHPSAEAGPGVMPRTRGHRVRRWAAMALGICAALAVLVIAPQVSHAHLNETLDGNGLALISASDGELRAAVPLQAPPTDMAAGFGSVWVAEASAGLVVRVDLRRRAVVATIAVGTSPSAIVAAGGQVWVLDTADRTVSSINPQTDTVTQTIAVGDEPSDLLVSAGSLWVASQDDGTVQQIDPSTGHPQILIRTGGDPSGLAAADGAVWVATDESGAIERIDARTGAVTTTIRVGDAPAAAAVGAAGLWVLNPLDATVSQVDPRRDTVMATVPLGGAPTALTQSGGFVWVTDEQDGTLLRLDPRRDVVTAFSVGGRPIALAAAGGGIWIAVDAAGASHRGGTLTSINSYADIDTIDPAASTSPNVAPPQLFGLTNDGLVTLNHVAGPAGTRLVPDLALALPAPTDNGRIYTFHLRPGIQYSTGAFVKPTDVIRSFERLFELDSSGASNYQAIDGEAACVAAPKSCDLSQGIVADNRTGVVTFRLTQPDPDFLYKLTLAYADILPASTPARQATTPLPATGPYLISRYVPGQQLLLVRNPYFREWSAAAQPYGYPDRIVIRLGLSAAQGAATVAAGQGDFMPNLGQIPGSEAAYFLRHRGQVRINPLMVTGLMFLNVNAAPFNDVRVRQAVNLALDRQQVVNGYGGLLAAQPTCQILPPQIPGYRRYCPYTRSPSVDGLWHGPDLARARELVAASGTTGMHITVWNTPTPLAAVDETLDTVTALRQLGYQVSLRLLPDSTYFSYTGDSRNQAQVIDGGWSADYPSADDFIGKLTCNYFAPGNGLATTDASEFCDPALDMQIARAAALQTTDPSAAAALWAGLDRQFTDLAIWLPTVTPNEIDIISRRAGDYQYNPVWGTLIDQLWLR
jgi:YVTN family beta-propeller protein